MGEERSEGDNKWFTKEKLKNILSQYATPLESSESSTMGLNFKKSIMKADETDFQNSNLFVSQDMALRYYKDVSGSRRNVERNEKVPVSTETIHCTRHIAPVVAPVSGPTSPTVRRDRISSVAPPEPSFTDYFYGNSSDIPIPGLDCETFRPAEDPGRVSNTSQDLIDFNTPYSDKRFTSPVAKETSLEEFNAPETSVASKLSNKSNLEDLMDSCRTSEYLEAQLSENSTVYKTSDDLFRPRDSNIAMMQEDIESRLSNARTAEGEICSSKELPASMKLNDVEGRVSRNSALRLPEDTESHISSDSFYSRKLEDPEGLIPRNSNVSRTLEDGSHINKDKSNKLQLVAQLLHRFDRDIDCTSQVLGKALKNQLKTVTSIANNEVRLNQIENLIHDSSVVKVDTILDQLNNVKIDKNEQSLSTKTDVYGIGSTENDVHLEADRDKIETNQVLNNLDPCYTNKIQNTTTLLRSERIVNRLRSPGEERTNKVINEPRTNANHSMSTTPPIKTQSNEDENEIIASKIKFPSPDHKQSEDGMLSGIAENLNEKLLVSSSESSVRRGQVPKVKKSRSRKLIKANFSTIISTMVTDETEKQRRIDDYVEASMQHVTRANKALVGASNERHKDNVAQGGVGNETPRINTVHFGVSHERHKDNVAQGGVDNETPIINTVQFGVSNERHKDNIIQVGVANNRNRDNTTLVGVGNEIHRINAGQFGRDNDINKAKTAQVGLGNQTDNIAVSLVDNEIHRVNAEQFERDNDLKKASTAQLGVGNETPDIAVFRVGNEIDRYDTTLVGVGNNINRTNSELIGVGNETWEVSTAQDKVYNQSNNKPLEIDRSSAESKLIQVDFEPYNSTMKTSQSCNNQVNDPSEGDENFDTDSKVSRPKENESHVSKVFEKVDNNDQLDTLGDNVVTKAEAVDCKARDDGLLFTSADSEGNVFVAKLLDGKVEHGVASSTSSEVLRRPPAQETSVKKKKRCRRARQLDGPAPGVSLRSLAKRSNIFECLETPSHSADVSSEETSSSAPQQLRDRSNRNKSESINPSRHQSESVPSTNKGSNKIADPRDSSYRRKSVDSNPRVDPDEPGASHSLGCKDQSDRDTSSHTRANQTREGVVKTQKWYWLTLRQELLLKDKVSRTIKVKVMRVSGVAEFFCQTVDVFPELEKGFKDLFVASNSPAESRSPPPAAACPRPARLVMARDPKSRLWYRSEVLQRDESRRVCKVFFVDFGTETYVGESDIREIQPAYTAIPYQAIRCELYNVVVSRAPEFTASPDCVNCYRVWSSLIQAGQTYEVKVEQILESKKTVAISMETDGFDMGQMLALQCYTPFVEVKSPAIQGDWREFVYDN